MDEKDMKAKIGLVLLESALSKTECIDQMYELFKEFSKLTALTGLGAKDNEK